MNTLLKMKISFPSPVADEQRVTLQPPPATPSSGGGSTDPRQFIALMAQQKRREARVRRWKRVGLAVVTTGAAAAYFLVGSPGPDPVAGPSATAAVEAPAAPEPALPEPAVLAARGLADQPAPVAATPMAPAAPVAAPAALAAAPEAAPAPVTESLAAAPAAEPAPSSSSSLPSELSASPPTAEPAGSSWRPSPKTPVPASLSAGIQPGASACETEFSERRWKAATETCEAAFNQSASAATALRVAHANYSRGRVRNAGKWAATAVALGTEDADAYVLIGHSERRGGHREEAISAYRRYLDASPNGWHARHVRAALRALQPRLVVR